jgi:hypothetical protein
MSRFNVIDNNSILQFGSEDDNLIFKMQYWIKDKKVVESCSKSEIKQTISSEFQPKEGNLEKEKRTKIALEYYNHQERNKKAIKRKHHKACITNLRKEILGNRPGKKKVNKKRTTTDQLYVYCLLFL